MSVYKLMKVLSLIMDDTTGLPYGYRREIVKAIHPLCCGSSFLSHRNFFVVKNKNQGIEPHGETVKPSLKGTGHYHALHTEMQRSHLEYAMSVIVGGIARCARWIKARSPAHCVRYANWGLFPTGLTVSVRVW